MSTTRTYKEVFEKECEIKGWHCPEDFDQKFQVCRCFWGIQQEDCDPFGCDNHWEESFKGEDIILGEEVYNATRPALKNHVESDKPVMAGVGKEAPVVTNEQGGKQSQSEYAFHLIPPEAMVALAKVLAEGAKKYDAWNWTKIPYEEHYNHAITHYYAHVLGDTQDDHAEHFLCRAVMTYYMMVKK